MSHDDLPLDADLDLRLHELAREIGDLPGLENAVGRAVDRAEIALEHPEVHDRPPLEALVGESLQAAERFGRRGRLRRILWPAAMAVSAAAVVLVLVWGRRGGEALASIEAPQGCEVKSTEDGRWRTQVGRIDLGRGAEVRSVAGRPVPIQFVTGGAATLHPKSRLRLESEESRGGARRLRTRLVYGGMDVRGSSRGGVIVLVRAGSSECRVARAHVQVLRRPDRGVVVAAYSGRATVRAAGRQRAVEAGSGLFVRDGDGNGGESRVTRFELDNGSLSELMHEIRRRWSRYVTRDERRRETGVFTVTFRLTARARKLSEADDVSEKPQIRVVRVPVPRAGLREKARRFLAAHTADDRRFVNDALEEALGAGLPEIAARSVTALLLMGETRAAVAERITRAPASFAERGHEPAEMARLAARAALGDTDARAAVERALDADYPLETRILAVLAAAGQPDAGLRPRVCALAEDSADDLYRYWRASTDFCEAVGMALVGRADEDGLVRARDLVSDPSLPLKARRRYLSGIVRELADRPAVWQAFLLGLYPRLDAPRFRRAVLTEFVRARPRARDAVVADFFRDVVEAGGESAPMALTGLMLYAPAASRATVVRELLGILDGGGDARLRSGAARALGTEADGSGSSAVVRALERALADESDGVRYWAAQALERLGGRASVGPVLDALAEEHTDRCRVALLDTLGGLEGADQDPAVVRALAREIRTGPPHLVMRAYLRALGRLGSDEARLVLEDLAAFADDPSVRRAAGEELEALKEAGR